MVIRRGSIFREKVIEIHRDEDPDLMLNSLMKLLRYDFEYLFCSSGKVLPGNARRAIVAKIAFWEEQRELVRYLYQQGLAAEEIRDRLYGPESSLYQKCEEELGKIHLVRAFSKATLKMGSSNSILKSVPDSAKESLVQCYSSNISTNIHF